MMKPQVLVAAIAMALVSLVGRQAWAQVAPATTPASVASAARQLPKLAVATSVQEPTGQSRENVEDLLMVELGNQAFLKLVDRQALQAVMKEHAIALSKVGDTKNAIALGKFAAADYLLYVLVAKDKALVQLVEVATGQVKMEDEVKLSADLPLFCAAIREEVLAALLPESQSVNRLTVGIAAFTNRSGTDRSDKLGIELQMALRSRLKDEAWTVVLERQYPTALLEEVDLARMGLVRDKAVETLPPADLVILGTMQDASNEYVAGKPWEVKLDLTVRVRDRRSQVSQTCRSDAVETAADDIVRKINEFRGQPISPIGIPEKELWRRQARYLMPSSGRPYVGRPYGRIDERAEKDTVEMIRAWENVLLLDSDDADAMTNLGLCLIALNQYSVGDPVRATKAQRQAAVAQCLAGSLLVERALRIQAAPAQTLAFCWCAESLDHRAPVRAKEMAQYMVDHRDLFKGIESYHWDVIDIVRKSPALTIDDSRNTFYAELDKAIQNAEKNPDGVYLAFERFNSSGKGDHEQTALFLAPYFDHPDPVVQFGVHRTMGDVACWGKNDPTGLEHYDRAIAAIDAARRRLTVYYASMVLDDIYRLKIIACEHCRRPEEAKKTALAGTRRFMEAGPCNGSAAWLYHYCVTQVLGPGQEKEALRICDAFIAGMNGPHRFTSPLAARVLGKREELVTALDGRPVPDLGGLRLASGTGPREFYREGERCMIMLGLAATDGRLWLASPQGPSMRWGTALWYRPDLDETQSVSSVTDPVCCVAATRDFVFFGGLRDGLYKLDRDGRLLKHYRRNEGAFPMERIVDLCAGGGRVYVCYSNGSRDGVAALDPATDNLTVLAPSTREARPQSEPVADVLRVWWDAATPRLYASSHDRSHWYYPPLLCQYAWTPDGKTWERLTGEEAPRSVVSQGDETLVVRVRGKQVEFRFPRTGQTVEAEVPLPSLMGDPAWDEHRIWVPSAAGLYEIDRGTARITWLAYQNDTLFFSALKHAGRLYVATSRGLYYREIL